MSDWTPVSCQTADVIRHSGQVTPSAGRTDLCGQFGEPCIYTEWASTLHSSGDLVLREWRYPSPVPGEPDLRPCRHEAAAPNSERTTP